jgi:hypothetical protein
MVQRWAAASFLATEKNFRRIIGLERSLAIGDDLRQKATIQQEAA